MIHSVKSIQEHSTTAEINGKWVPARPLNPFVFWWRIKDAWMVFCGKADVLVWPEDQ